MIIVGSGPAGYTAALYTARANLEPLVFEGFQWGGQLQNTTDVENYPGFPEGIMGPDMMMKFRAQAERFGTRSSPTTSTASSFPISSAACRSVFLGDEGDRAKTVILAMGRSPKSSASPARRSSRPRRLLLRHLRRRLLQGAQTVIVGGGDSAMEDSIFLSKFADKVTIVHRREEFRASKIMLERARGQENIDILTPYAVERSCRREWLAGHAKLAIPRPARSASTGDRRLRRRSATCRSRRSSRVRSRSTRTAT